MSSNDKTVLGLIPAKGGSARLARKNVARLGGKSLLAWAVDAARESGVIDRLILSTEDMQIAQKAESLGVEVPFLRPVELSRDPAGVVDVALHALDQLDDSYETLIIMLPTCPLRTAADVCDALALYRERGATSLMSVSEFDHTPYAALDIRQDGTLAPHFPEYFGRRSQDMPAAYRPNGAIHILNVARFRTERSYIAPPVLAYVMPRARSVDIDTIEDLRLAETLLAVEA